MDPFAGRFDDIYRQVGAGNLVKNPMGGMKNKPKPSPPEQQSAGVCIKQTPISLSTFLHVHTRTERTDFLHCSPIHIFHTVQTCTRTQTPYTSNPLHHTQTSLVIDAAALFGSSSAQQAPPVNQVPALKEGDLEDFLGECLVRERNKAAESSSDVHVGNHAATIRMFSSTLLWAIAH